MARRDNYRVITWPSHKAGADLKFGFGLIFFNFFNFLLSPKSHF